MTKFISKIILRRFCGKRDLLFVSLLFAVVLVSSCFISIFDSGVSPFVLGVSDQIVRNEVELRSAVNNAVRPTVIAFDNDITITEALVIPVDKDLTLTSTSSSEFFKLIGGDARTTLGPAEWPDAVIIVSGDGVLRLDGIVVTCANNPLAYNKLVRVEVCGTLILYNGEISGNSVGDGVVNGGTFEMYGGKISNNNGRGVVNGECCTFSMFGGEISNNTGSGVYNRGGYDWGWVYGVFKMLGGEISNNKDSGVYNRGIFSMSGGVISNNQAVNGGGVYNQLLGSKFSLSKNGVISNNTAEVGGGLYNAGTFNRWGGRISDNTATQYSDICHSDDSNTIDYRVLVVSIVVIVFIIVGGLLAYSKKAQKQQPQNKTNHHLQ
jgi:hypothetical protein